MSAKLSESVVSGSIYWLFNFSSSGVPKNNRSRDLKFWIPFIFLLFLTIQTSKKKIRSQLFKQQKEPIIESSVSQTDPTKWMQIKTIKTNYNSCHHQKQVRSRQRQRQTKTTLTSIQTKKKKIENICLPTKGHSLLKKQQLKKRSLLLLLLLFFLKNKQQLLVN